MSEFTKYNAVTHPIIKLEDDWNNIVDHAFEKTTDFIIRRTSVDQYNAIYGYGSNQAGKILATTTTPDITELLTTCQNVLTSGGKIAIGRGTFIQATEFDWTQDNLFIQGIGMGISINQGTTIIQEKSGANLTQMIHLSNVDNGTLKDMLLDGNKTVNPTGLYGIQYATGYNFVMENVAVWRCKSHGIRISALAGGFFKNCYSETHDGRGWEITNNARANVFENCIAAADASDGFFLFDNVWGNTFIGCITDTDGGYGFYLVGNYPGGGVYVRQNTFLGCQVQSPAKDGFKILNGTLNSLIGCQIHDAGRLTNNTYSGIEFGTYGGAHSTRNTINGCTIFSDTANKLKYGILEVDANQDYNIITSNQVSTAVTDQILKQGANSIEANNIEV